MVTLMQPEQFLYASNYFQRKFTFVDETTPNDVRICRYLNNFLKVIGDNIVIKGGNVKSIVKNSDIVSVMIETGKLVSDMTLINFPNFLLDINTLNYTGDSVNTSLTKFKTVLDTISTISTVISDKSLIITFANSNFSYQNNNTNFNFVKNNNTLSISLSDIELLNYDNLSIKPNFSLILPNNSKYIINVRLNNSNIINDNTSSGYVNLTVDIKKSYYIIIYTDFQYLNIDRTVQTDPCPFLFKIGLYDIITNTFSDPSIIWNIVKNKIILCALDCFNYNILEKVKINNINYYIKNINNYNFFNINSYLDGGMVNKDDIDSGDQTNVNLNSLTE